jgi:hypothetical protein
MEQSSARRVQRSFDIVVIWFQDSGANGGDSMPWAQQVRLLPQRFTDVRTGLAILPSEIAASKASAVRVNDLKVAGAACGG